MFTLGDWSVLTPLVGGVIAISLNRARLRHDAFPSPGDVSKVDDVQVYRGPQNLLGVILSLAVIIPIGVLFLPDSVVLDVRPLFNFSGTIAGILLFLCWLYLRYYKITLNGPMLTYGAFRLKTIDLRQVTRIHYHWVNDGISLKLYSENKRIAIFEGNVARFDDFAKSVRSRLPKDAIAETVGLASF